MSKIDAMMAPRALLSDEVASVIAPQLLAYGLANRAFTQVGIWNCDDSAVISAAEETLADIVACAERSMKEWLGDMQSDGQPRFYQAAGLKKAISELHISAGRIIAGQVQEAIAATVEMLKDRDAQMLNVIITQAG